MYDQDSLICNKQLLDEVYSDMQNYQCRGKSFGSADNSYRDIEILHITIKAHPRIVLLYISSGKKPKTKSNNCFIRDFKPKIINMARKTIKNKHRRLNMQITEFSVSQ